tara:strand:- start:111968 stop:113080 length:1113 start_codon:yes stop_codon:yes gene_type:complete
MIILQILAIIAVPFALLQIEKKWASIKAIVMSYVVGIAIGNFLPSLFDTSVVTEITGISIILAIPLMLFPTRIQQVLKQPKTLLVSYALAVIATTISVLVGFVVFQVDLPDIHLISGMLEGVYTGGTVNLNAIGIAFHVPNELVVLMNGFDWAFSGFYLLLIFTVLPKILGFVLPKTESSYVGVTVENESNFGKLTLWQKTVSLAKGMGLSVLVLGVMAGISYLGWGGINEVVLIFGVTGLALVLSTIQGVQRMPGNMVASDFLMLVFGFSLGLQANVWQLFSDRSELFNYFLLTYSLMLVVHLLLARLFRIDVHSFLISSTAAVFGPPFIGPIAESLGNRSLITGGIIIALIGNAIGTYLGILIIGLLS